MFSLLKYSAWLVNMLVMICGTVYLNKTEASVLGQPLYLWFIYHNECPMDMHGVRVITIACK